MPFNGMFSGLSKNPGYVTDQYADAANGMQKAIANIVSAGSNFDTAMNNSRQLDIQDKHYSRVDAAKAKADKANRELSERKFEESVRHNKATEANTAKAYAAQESNAKANLESIKAKASAAAQKIADAKKAKQDAIDQKKIISDFNSDNVKIDFTQIGKTSQQIETQTPIQQSDPEYNSLVKSSVQAYIDEAAKRGNTRPLESRDAFEKSKVPSEIVDITKTIDDLNNLQANPIDIANKIKSKAQILFNSNATTDKMTNEELDFATKTPLDKIPSSFVSKNPAVKNVIFARRILEGVGQKVEQLHNILPKKYNSFFSTDRIKIDKDHPFDTSIVTSDDQPVLAPGFNAFYDQVKYGEVKESVNNDLRDIANRAKRALSNQNLTQREYQSKVLNPSIRFGQKQGWFSRYGTNTVDVPAGPSIVNQKVQDYIKQMEERAKERYPNDTNKQNTYMNFAYNTAGHLKNRFNTVSVKNRAKEIAATSKRNASKSKAHNKAIKTAIRRAEKTINSQKTKLINLKARLAKLKYTKTPKAAAEAKLVQEQINMLMQALGRSSNMPNKTKANP